MKKAKIIEDEMTKYGEENDSNVDFLASTGWFQNFMKRDGVSIWRKTSIAQKIHMSWLTSWYYLLILFVDIICFVCSIPEFEIPGIWYNFYGRNNCMCRYGIWYNSWYYLHKYCYQINWLRKISRFCVPCCKGDGRKLPTMIVFKNAKGEVCAVDKVFWQMPHEGKRQVFTSCKENWYEHCSLWVHKIHPNPRWNKPFKVLTTEKYVKWLAEEGINQETPAGNFKPPPRRAIVDWTMETWKEITSDVTKNLAKRVHWICLQIGQKMIWSTFSKTISPANPEKSIMRP